MLYTEKEKHEIDRVKEVFAEHLRQSPDFELLWSDKVGYVWLTIGVNPLYVDTGIRIESAADLCGRCLDDVASDKVIERYYKSINNIKELLNICDIVHVYDNTKTPERIIRKHKEELSIYPNKYWNELDILELME